MNSIFETPQFGLILTIFVYFGGKYLYDKTKILLFYPLFTVTTVIIGILLITKIPYSSYNIGGEYITYLLGPVTVALAVPLYRKFQYIKKDILPIFLGVLIGSVVSIIYIFYLSQFFGFSQELTISLLPKSVTTPISKSISEEFGGIQSITVFATILSGIVGGSIGPIIFKLFRIRSKVAQGIALGTAAHGAGTAKALEMGEVQGSMSGLAMGLAGIITGIIFPVLYRILFE